MRDISFETMLRENCHPFCQMSFELIECLWFLQLFCFILELVDIFHDGIEYTPCVIHEWFHVAIQFISYSVKFAIMLN